MKYLQNINQKAKRLLLGSGCHDCGHRIEYGPDLIMCLIINERNIDHKYICNKWCTRGCETCRYSQTSTSGFMDISIVCRKNNEIFKKIPRKRICKNYDHKPHGFFI